MFESLLPEPPLLVPAELVSVELESVVLVSELGATGITVPVSLELLGGVVELDPLPPPELGSGLPY